MTAEPDLDAVVVRACALISDDLDPTRPRNGALRLTDRTTLEPLLGMPGPGRDQ